MGRSVGASRPCARAAHRCELCDHRIEPGTVYDRWCWIEDGQAATVRTHTGCWKLAQLAPPTDPWAGTWEIGPDTLRRALLWRAPTRDECVEIAGEIGGRLWDEVLDGK